MKNNYTHLSILLDRSGSMNKIKSDIIGGFNSLIDEQKKTPGELTVTLVQFDNEYEELYNMIELDSVQRLNEDIYIPRNTTALNDSFARLIHDTGSKLSSMDESERPDKVIFVCISDGKENASKEYDNASLKKIIEHQQSKYQWEFLYVGANQDSFQESSSKGIKHFVNFRASSPGVFAMSADLSQKLTSYRSTGKIDDSNNNV